MLTLPELDVLQPLYTFGKLDGLTLTSIGIGTYLGEADAATSKKPKFRQMELNLKKLIGLAYATDELLQDSTALEAVVFSR